MTIFFISILQANCIKEVIILNHID